MSVTIDLYSYDTKFNSTKIPRSDIGFYCRYYCLLNKGCSILNPTLVINNDATPDIFTADGNDVKGGSYGNPFDSRPIDGRPLSAWKMLYIFEFGRWYYITDIIYDSGFWYINCEVNVLASYRNQILGSTQLVARSSKNWNTTIIDTLTPIVGYPNSNTVKINVSDFITDDLYYVLSVANYTDTNARGMMTSYVLSENQMKSLKKFLLSDPQQYLGNITDVTPNMLKALFNPLQYISACKAYTFKPEILISSATIQIGYWDTGITCLGIASPLMNNFNIGVEVPNNEFLTANRPIYLNVSPYREVWLKFLPFYSGYLDTSKFFHTNKLHIFISVDCLSGQGIMTLKTQDTDGTYHSIDEYVSQVGIDVPLSQILSDYYGSAVQRTTLNANNVASSLESANMSLELQKMSNTQASAIKQDSISYAGDVVNGLSSVFSLNISGAANAALDAARTTVNANERNANYSLSANQVQNNIIANVQKRSAINAQGQYSIVSAAMPKASIIGSYSSFAQIKDSKEIVVLSHNQIESNVSIHGKPMMNYAKLSDLSEGYVECIKPTINCGLAIEKGKILSFLESGVYLE